MTVPPPVLELRDLEKSFGSLQIIRGADLLVRAGERHAVIGPNGAGKSTLFNLISGRFPPDSGEIYLRGSRIDGLSPEKINRLGLGRSFQITSLFPRLSALENVRIAAMRHLIRPFFAIGALDRHAEVTARAEELLDVVGLSERRDVVAAELPYSEQRALEIALTLATEPEVILLDEPTSGMSRSEAAHITGLVGSTIGARTLLVVEHDMDVVFRLCDRISVVVYGRVIATGTPDEIRDNTAVREAYLGSQANGPRAS